MKRLKTLAGGCAAALFWLLIWEGLALLTNRELLLPAPLTVLRRLIALAATGAFWRTAGVSLLRILCGIAAALAVGTLLAAASCRFRPAEMLLRPLLTVVKATPVASFIILALLWMGRGVLPGFIAALVVIPVVYANVSAGIRSTDVQLLEAARVFRFSGAKTLFKVCVPSVMPHFLSACRSALALGWKAGVAAEVLTVPAVSIGKMLYESKLYLDTVDLFAWTTVVVLCSLVIEKLLIAALTRAEGVCRHD